MVSEKQIKAALKEGGKKGQDIEGNFELGIAKLFCVRSETANGKWELMDKILEGMNKEVDPNGEDRKGGAGHIGKTILFANDEVVLILNHVPKPAAELVDQKEWFDVIVKGASAEVIGEPVTLPGDGGVVLKAEMKRDPEANKFPIKAIDQAMSDSYYFLLGKGLVATQDSDDDQDYSEAAGIEW